MKESGYQARIMSQIKQNGGWSVNGNFTLAGEPDLQCGIMHLIPNYNKEVMLYVAVEVKDDFNYHRVMKGIDENYNVIDKKKLKGHEILQMAKIREIRKRGGLALVAYNHKQVMEYVDKEMK